MATDQKTTDEPATADLEVYRLPEVEQILAAYYGKTHTPLIRRLCWTILQYWGSTPPWILREQQRQERDPRLAYPKEPEVERAALALIFRAPLHGFPVDRLVERLETADFAEVNHRFLFTESRLLIDSGEPISESAAISRWFVGVACKRRALEAGVNERPSALVAELLGPTIFASPENQEYYLKVLRKARLRRRFHHIAMELRKYDLAHEYAPVETIEWLQREIDEAWVKAEECFPEEIAK
jgi:hypothetical protein